jgi:hypothetical protein
MSTKQDPAIEPFAEFIEALDPCLDQVVLIGGWEHRWYRLDSRARKLKYLPLEDVAVGLASMHKIATFGLT